MTADPCELAPVDLDQPPGFTRDGQPADRWQPDWQLVPAIMSMPRSPRKLTEYPKPDQCWIVAGLTLAGWSVAEIEARCSGSERLIKGLRAEPMTELCKLMQVETFKLEAALRVERINHAATAHQLRQSDRAVARLGTQVDQLLAAHMTGELSTFACGHPKVRYNTYQHGGRSYCRQCRTDRQARRRTLTCIVVNG